MSHAHTKSLSADQIRIPDGHVWHRLPVIGLVVGVLGLGAAFALGSGDMKQFYHSYLVAFCFFLTIALGGFFFVLVQYLARAGWSVVVRRTAENLMGTLPLFAVLFIPIILGMHDLYHWTHEEAVAGDHLLQGKSPFLNTGFFLVRAAIYFVVWAGASWYFRSRSLAQDEGGDKEATRRTQAVAAPVLMLYALSQTFAAIDWLMSLDPHWYSTMFGVYFFAGSLVAVIGSLSAISLVMRKMGLLAEVITTEHYHDLGKLLFGFTVFWAYIGFSQFFLIWYGNIPEETLWFHHRLEGSWKPFTLFLAVGHFIVPFFILINRTIKRIPATLLIMALWMLGMHFLDLYWLVMPNLHPHGVHFTLVDVMAFIGIGGFFLGAFTWLTKRAALVPHRDPRLHESLRFENA